MFVRSDSDKSGGPPTYALRAAMVPGVRDFFDRNAHTRTYREPYTGRKLKQPNQTYIC